MRGFLAKRKPALLPYLCCMMVLASGDACGQIRDEPYLQGDEVSPNTIVIRWFTVQDSDSWVDYGLTEQYEHTKGKSESTKEHRIGLAGLMEDTIYHYRVRSGSCESTDGTFRTFSSDPDREFTFVAYGDNRSNPVKHEAIAERILTEPLRPSFILNSGDVVASGEERQEWHDQFFGPAKNLFKACAVFPAPGNHEYEDGLIWEEMPHEWYDFLSLPENGTLFGAERWYSFDYGCCHVVCLDSHLYDGANPLEIPFQKSWLEDDLTAASAARWKIVFFHHPPYSKGGHDSNLLVRAEFCPIFDDYGVDVVFNGHNHFYQRSFPMRNYGITSDDPHRYSGSDGTIYVVTGGGGAGLYTPVDTWFVANQEEINHYCRIEVDGGWLRCDTINIDGELIDYFLIHKGGVHRNRAVHQR